MRECFVCLNTGAFRLFYVDTLARPNIRKFGKGGRYIFGYIWSAASDLRYFYR